MPFKPVAKSEDRSPDRASLTIKFEGTEAVDFKTIATEAGTSTTNLAYQMIRYCMKEYQEAKK